MDSRKHITKIRSAISKPKMFPMVIVAFPILIAALGVSALAQTFSDWSAPANLGSPVNMTAFEGTPFISNDGLDLFITTNRPTGSGPNDLYVSHREARDWHWGEPVSLGADINTTLYQEIAPILTRSGQHLIFVSDRPGGCGGFDIWVARRLSEHSFAHWSPPENLGCQVNSVGVELGPSLIEDHDGTVYLYFSSGLRPGGLGFGDIYVSTLQTDGTFGPARPISEFNTPFNEIRPTVRGDGLEIFFDSNRPGSMEGSPDLYTSTRASTSSPWTTPVNLGPMVNSSAIDGGARLSSDGTELYFMSNRPGGFGNQDIWVITRTEMH